MVLNLKKEFLTFRNTDGFYGILFIYFSSLFSLTRKCRLNERARKMMSNNDNKTNTNLFQVVFYLLHISKPGIFTLALRTRK